MVGLAHRVLTLYAGDLEHHYSFLHGQELAEKLRQFSPEWVVLYYPRHVSRDRYELLEAHGLALERTFPGWVDWSNGDVLVYRASMVRLQKDASHPSDRKDPRRSL